MSRPPGSRGDDLSGTVTALSLVDKFQSALRRGDRAAVVDLARQLVEARAPLGGNWLSLAFIVAHHGEASLAREAFDRYLEGAGGDPTAALRKFDLLAVVGAWDEALAYARGFPADQQGNASYAYARGTAALYMGESDEARRYLEEATRLHPQYASPWLSLALLVDFAREPELTEHLLASRRSMESAAPVERGNYFYALGKAYADLGEPAQAFAAYAQGAALLKTQFPYSREQDRAAATEAVSGYDAGRIAALANRQSEPTGRGMFVMGLPRSGTTLVEQILTSHSAVGDGGEIYRLGLLAKDVGGLSGEAMQAYVDGGGAPEAARLWRHWLDERFPAPGRIVDKTLVTTRHLGLAAALLPEAPLIWLTRDPLDCAWSCFRTRFAAEAAWSYDLEDIAFHFRLEDELLARWQDMLGDRLLVVPYESLVAEPEPWTRRILAHCGLPEERAVFAPHEQRRAVTTYSTMQVRRPINSSSVGVAQSYREFLEPFAKAYFG